MEIDLSEVKKLVELVESHHLEEITVEEGDLSITVRSRSIRPAQAAPPLTQAVDTHVGQEEASKSVEPTELLPEFEGEIVEIKSPLVGVFYRSPSPDAPSFIEVGDEIEVGSEVGLIEAMKVFSPIPSEVAGVVVEIPAANGKLVQEGEVLVRVRV